MLIASIIEASSEQRLAKKHGWSWDNFILSKFYFHSSYIFFLKVSTTTFLFVDVKNGLPHFLKEFFLFNSAFHWSNNLVGYLKQSKTHCSVVCKYNTWKNPKKSTNYKILWFSVVIFVVCIKTSKNYQTSFLSCYSQLLLLSK